MLQPGSNCYSFSVVRLVTCSLTCHSSHNAIITAINSVIIIIIILIATFIQGNIYIIYIYIPDKSMFLGYVMLQLFCIYNLCYTTRNVISPVKYVVYFYISTFRGMCAVPNTSPSCSSLISCFPSMLLRYCQRDFETVPVAPVTTVINFAFLLLSLLLLSSSQSGRKGSVSKIIRCGLQTHISIPSTRRTFLIVTITKSCSNIKWLQGLN